MKKIFILMMAVLLAATVFVSCGSSDADKADGAQKEAVIPEGWTYSPEMLVGAWDYQYEMTGEYYGYRFNEDGTLDDLYNRMYSPMGYYECREDGVHYSPDGETWDELVMVIKSLSKDELVISFDGYETALTRYEGEVKEYMPDGWTYVEGTDEEIASATGTGKAE